MSPLRYRSARFALVVAGLLALALTMRINPAQAVEKQQHISIAPSFALLKVADSDAAPGVGLGANYTYGLKDQWNLLFEASGAYLAVSHDIPDGAKAAPLTRPAFVGRASVGAAYVLDVLRWVPYAGLLASTAYLTGGTMPSGKLVPNIELALGLDYQFNRKFVAGLAYRQSFFFTTLDTYPSYSNFFAKLEYQWGY